MKKIKSCHHDKTEEVDRNEKSGNLKIRLKCLECGVTLLEKYTFVEGKELDEKGNTAGTYYR